MFDFVVLKILHKNFGPCGRNKVKVPFIFGGYMKKIILFWIFLTLRISQLFWHNYFFHTCSLDTGDGGIIITSLGFEAWNQKNKKIELFLELFELKQAHITYEAKPRELHFVRFVLLVSIVLLVAIGTFVANGTQLLLELLLPLKLSCHWNFAIRTFVTIRT